MKKKKADLIFLVVWFVLTVWNVGGLYVHLMQHSYWAVLDGALIGYAAWNLNRTAHRLIRKEVTEDE